MRSVRRLIFPLLSLLLLLSACAVPEELDREALGWEEDWETVGTVAAVEPLEGFKAAENLDIMSGQGLWYAAWNCGEGREIKNEDGQDAVLFPAQIYFLIEELESPAKAAAEVELWHSRERESYACSESVSQTHAGADWSVTALTAPEENPFDGGFAAFAVIGRYAVSVELMVLEDAPIDPEETMNVFLDGLHFNLEEA